MSNNHSHISIIQDESVIENDTDLSAVKIGQWYWVSDDETRSKDDPIVAPDGKPYLMCVTDIGSNYVELTEPSFDGGSRSWRVHIEDFDKELLYEPRAEEIIQQNIRHHQGRVNGLLNHVKRITKQLGVPANKALSAEMGGSESGTGLAVVSQTTDIIGYKKKLLSAQNKLLPKLFKRIKVENKILTKWMSAETVSLDAELNMLGEVKNVVEERVFNVSLYAGLTEQVVTIKDGNPASYHEKVNLFQRMMFMDEECLLNYEAGGMEFKNISEFDRWFSLKENYERILPFPKCVSVFRVRRNEKHREANSIGAAWANFQLAQADKYTFMYIRNGEKIFRLTLEDFEFGTKLFPDAGAFDPSEEMMAKISPSGSIESLMPKREFELLKKEQEENDRNFQQWFIDNPFEEWKEKKYEQELSKLKEIEEKDSARFVELLERLENDRESENSVWWRWANPYEEHSSFRSDSYSPFNPSNVYYDDILKDIKSKITKFNRMALILQGLLDRSDVFHPHPPVKTWETEGFKQIINLVYDASMVLHYGEAPDIQKYIETCNQSINTNSVLYGQQDLWELKEGEKECDRRRRSYRYSRDNYMPNRWTPEGNPGPGTLAIPDKVQNRAKKAIFSWHREIVSWSSDSYGEKRRATFKVEFSKLFNVSAYQIGDYKRFFNDPRTREKYLEWAPMLLTAEEHHQGIREAKKPVLK